MTHVIVLGNEKGGSGKSTAAMHIIIALMKSGFKVAAIDLDMRQRSLVRYLENRAQYAQNREIEMVMPYVPVLEASQIDSREAARAAELQAFTEVLSGLGAYDYVVIDCPGADSYFSRIAHDHADTIVTPLNDSFVDFDLLAKLDPKTGEILAPSIYSEMVWTARKRRAMSRRSGRH